MTARALLLACCAATYGAIGLVIVLRTRRMAPVLLALCCAITAGWALQDLLRPGTGDIESGADLVRAVGWFGFLFYLYHRAGLGRPLHEMGFALSALASIFLWSSTVLLPDAVVLQAGILPPALAARLGLAIVELLLIENLYFNLPDHARWHVALPSVLLGGLACFDIVLCADAVLSHGTSHALPDARTLGMLMIAPLLVVAAARGQRWRGRVRLSRAAAFHSATLVLSGGILLALGLFGELVRRLDATLGPVAEIGLIFAAALAIGLSLTSGSMRSRIQRIMVENFFAERYDYRRQWQACIRALSGEDTGLGGGLATRAVRTVGSVVDSPAGLLLLRDGSSGPFAWAGSWNLPAIEFVPDSHPVVAATRAGAWIARMDGPHQGALSAAPLDALPPLWLAVPLTHHGVLRGLVLCAPPRAPFDLEQEVFDLLRIVAQEVATYLAEQHATQTLLQTKELHDYGTRFAFVAHDIKNVASQLALMLSNAESHIGNPEFQQDMLDTVRSSVRKVTALLQRLERPEADRAPGTLAPLPVLERLVATYQRVRQAQVVLEHDGSTAAVAMGADAFETAVTHLLNNAVEATATVPGAAPALVQILVRVRHEVRRVVVEVVDTGPGMTPEFVRDRLFQPLDTSKPGGSGLGAYQARDLVRQAGGTLEVLSAPGSGTTMRLSLPRTDIRSAASGVGSGMAPVSAPALVLTGMLTGAGV